MNAARRRTVFFLMILGALLALVPACASQGHYVWVGDLPPSQGSDAYVISAGDLLNVRVFNQENLSTHARVRTDGKIAVPLLGDVAVAGRTPSDVTGELQKRFKQYVVSPEVTITVEEIQPTAVSVLGEVSHPGNYTLAGSAGVLAALAAAGGLTEYASRSGIYVVRHSPPQDVRFTFASLTDAESRAATFRLRPGDVVVVE